MAKHAKKLKNLGLPTDDFGRLQRDCIWLCGQIGGLAMLAETATDDPSPDNRDVAAEALPGMFDDLQHRASRILDAIEQLNMS